ncbi:uncharacterized protein LOC128502294 [Spea bombifrons]|uniref:uncharacterized protein LOC128502294 n=1 Tax=Spea bombifrons TaxID=233779 RepID=UPI00234B1A20|nr:uncharacterized protein LOC128502294 [Spea bombifrons]
MEEENSDTKPSGDDDCPKISEDSRANRNEATNTNMDSKDADDPAAAKTESEELKSEATEILNMPNNERDAPPVPAAPSENLSPDKDLPTSDPNADFCHRNEIKEHEDLLGNEDPQMQTECGTPEDDSGEEVPTNPGVVTGENDIITDEMMEIEPEMSPALSERGSSGDATKGGEPPNSEPVHGYDPSALRASSKMSENPSNPGGNERSQLPAAEEDKSPENSSGKSLFIWESLPGAGDGQTRSAKETQGLIMGSEAGNPPTVALGGTPRDDLMDTGDGNPPTADSTASTASDNPKAGVTASSQASREEPDGADKKSNRGSKEQVRIHFTEESVPHPSLLNYLCKKASLGGFNIRPLLDADDELSEIIIYHSPNSCLDQPEMMRRVDSVRRAHGSAELKVMVGGLRSAEAENAFRRYWDQRPVSSCELVLFTEADLDAVTEPKPQNRNLDAWKRILTREGTRSQKVGIFSRSSEEDYAWLRSLLRSEEFRNHVQEVRPCYISNNGGPQFRDDVSRCTFAILYHTKNRGRINVTDVTSALYDKELKYLHDKLGKENVIVVIDDLDICSSNEKKRILISQPSIEKLAKDLLLFGKEDKSDYKKYLGTLRDQEKKLREKLKTVTGWIEADAKINDGNHDEKIISKQNAETDSADEAYEDLTEDFQVTNNNGDIRHEEHVRETEPPQTGTCCHILILSKHIVGIFSRSSEEDYAWLRSLLRFGEFRDRVKEVRPCYISNNGGPRFRDEVSRCTFGILYHTKNRGRINVTDVEDSLYDRELEYLSNTFGRGKVVVVIDDMDDTGRSEKSRILENQPKIRKLARDLILISKASKESRKAIPVTPQQMFG